MSAACLLLTTITSLFISGGNAQSGNLTEEQRHAFNAARTLSIGYVVYPGAELLDIFGPLEILFHTSREYKMTLSMIGKTTGPVAARYPPHKMPGSDMILEYSQWISASYIATHTPQDAPALDILIVPGGVGNMALDSAGDTWIEDFVKLRYDQVDYLASICTGSENLARSGVLDGRKATTNKNAWERVVKNGPKVHWVPSARWVQDGNIWTSSGVAAGIDMTYALLKHIYGTEKLDTIMNGIEYAPHTDPHWDPFSVVHNVPGAVNQTNLDGCVGPVGID
ncbi:hypothetical protein FQN51_007681 [Onygenales sp. PD_10]|nr:hypothetical protein FQN51_007681 [Onygenales sp. PD_10]